MNPVSSPKAIRPATESGGASAPVEAPMPITEAEAPAISSASRPTAWRSEADAGPTGTRSERFDYLIHRYLVVADLLALALAAGVTVLLAGLTGRASVNLGWWAAVLVTAPLWVLIAHATGLYRMVERYYQVDIVDEFGPVVVGATAWIWGMVVVRSAVFSGDWDLFTPLALWMCLILALLSFRSVARIIARTRPWYRRPVAVIGPSEIVQNVICRIERHPGWGLDPEVVFISGPARRFEIGDPGRPGASSGWVGPDPAEVAAKVAELEIDRIVIAGDLSGLNARTELIRELVERRIGVDVVSGGVETLYNTAVAHHLEALPVLGVRPSTDRPLASRVKRMLDVILSALALLVLSPVLLWAAIRIKRDTPGPVLFRQDRIGLHGERFELLKFRTMVDGADAMREDLRAQTVDDGNDDVLFKLKEDPRVTGSGQSLRKWSLDELPQLWNVLRGDMSMVGPRPLVPEEAAMVTGHYKARELVHPGIAGPWQFLGRSEIPFDDMVKLDYGYVASWSNAEDMRLLARTLTAILTRHGAY